MGKTVKLPISNFLLDEPHAHADKLWGPYPSLDAAAAAIPTAMKVASFKFGVLSNGVFSEYIYLEDNGTPQELASLKVQLLLNPASGAVAGKILSLDKDLKPVWVDPSSTAERVSFDNSEEIFDGDVATTQAAIEALKHLLDALDGDVVKMILVNDSEVSIENGVASITIPDAVTSVITNNELVLQTPDGQSVKGKVGITTGADGLLHLTLTDEEGHVYSSPIAGLRVNGNALQYSNDGETWVTVQTFGKLAIKYVQASDPASGDVGDLALVGTTNAYVLKVYAGGSWVSGCDFGTLDLTSDGITIAGENKTLTQKMAEVVGNSNRIVAIGSDNTKQEYKLQLAAGRTYRFIVRPKTWSVSNVTSTYPVFRIEKYNNGSASDVYRVNANALASLADYYDVNAETNDYYLVTLRGDDGEKVYVQIEDVTDLLEATEKDIVLSDITRTNGNVDATTGAISTSTTNFYSDIAIPDGTKKVNFQTIKTSGTNGVAFLNGSGTWVGGYYNTSLAVGTRVTVQVPSAAKVMRFTYSTDSNADSKNYPRFDNIVFKVDSAGYAKILVDDAAELLEDELQAEMDSVRFKLDGYVDVSGLDQSNTGAVNSQNGEIAPNEGNFWADIAIPVGAESVDFQTIKSGQYTTTGVAFLDANGDCVGGYYTRTLDFGTRVTVAVPSTAKVFRFCYNTDAKAQSESRPLFDKVRFIAPIPSTLSGDDFPALSLIEGSPTTGFALTGIGTSVANANAQMCKYAVRAGDMLYLNLSKDNDGVYQFQNHPTVSQTDSAAQRARLVGTPATTAIKGFVVVPEGATYLIVSQSTSNTSNVVKGLSTSEEETIMDRCKRQIDNVFAGADYKRHQKVNQSDEGREKNFAMLMCSDIHGDGVRLNNALYLLEHCEAIDAAILLGDMEINNAQNESFIPTVLVPAANACTKDVLCVMGNHDQRRNENDTISTVDCAARYMGAITKNASIYDERGYGFKDFGSRKVRVIMLNCYDYTNDANTYHAGKMAQFGDTTLFLQEQIDWFIDALKTTPEGYAIIVAMHFPEPMTADTDVIKTHVGAQMTGYRITNVGETGYQTKTIISDIVNAYMTKAHLEDTYPYQDVEAYIHGDKFYHDAPSTPIEVDADFTGTNAKGTFACYIFGHIHYQFWGHVTDHPNQKGYGNDTSFCRIYDSNGDEVTSHMRTSLTPKNPNGASQDLVTVLCVDVENKLLHFVRVGANRNMFGDDTDWVTVPFSGQ